MAERGVFTLKGRGWQLARMAEIALLSPRRLTLEVIMDYSVKLYSVKLILDTVGVHWNNGQGVCRKRMMSSVIYLNGASWVHRGQGRVGQKLGACSAKRNWRELKQARSR